MMGSKISWAPMFTESVRVDYTIDGGGVCADGRIFNRVVGVVQSQHVGLVRAGLRIKVAARTDIRVRWPIGNERFFVVGQHVVATIPAEAVRLEAGIFRRSAQWWNRWIGRIVLVEPGDAGAVFTVKIHGEGWTLKAYGPVVGAREPSKPWDAVNVVVDPQRVDLSIVDGKPW
ncbi:MAG: hypothetical protein KGJ82_11895 [Nitrospirota bacterium]|nr:hypothetical protein [Nitrospirota bacterium]